MQREFTGRDMAKVLVAGFGVVVAVNFAMATLASRSFSGVVVDNSYVASQKFNGWLEEARKSDELGWSVSLSRKDDGHLTLVTQAVPQGALITAQLRRPLGAPESAQLTFAEAAPGTFRSAQRIGAGRWTARLSITADQSRWTNEVPIE